jgi:hypothetical protein
MRLNPSTKRLLQDLEIEKITYPYNSDIKVDGVKIVLWVCNDFRSRVDGTTRFPVRASGAEPHKGSWNTANQKLYKCLFFAVLK